MAGSRPKRRRPLSDNEWERIKPLLEHLYVEEGLHLKTIAARLAVEKSFDASISMYKSRLAKWNLRKNFKQVELKAAANKAEVFVKAGMQPPPMQIDDRIIPLKRVKRYLGDVLQGPLISIMADQRQSKKAVGPLRAQKARKRFNRHEVLEIPRIRCQQSPEMYLFEVTLRQVYAYYRWLLSTDDDYFLVQQQQHAGTTLETEEGACAMTDPWKLFDLVMDSFVAIDTKDSKLLEPTIRTLKTGSKCATHILSQKHPQALSAIITLSGLKQQNLAKVHLYKCILSYLLAMARNTLTENHPIRLILNLNQHQNEVEYPHFKVLTLMHDAAVRQFGPVSAKVLDIEEAMSTALCEQADFSTAHEFCQGLLSCYAKMFGKDHGRYRVLQWRLATLLHRYDRDSEAWSISQELVRTVPRLEQDTQPLDDVATRAAELLGDMCEDNKDFEGAAMWYREAANGSEQLYGAGNIEALFSLHRARQMEERVQAYETMGDGPSKLPNEAETSKEMQALVVDLEQDLSQLDLEAVDSCMRHETPYNNDEANEATHVGRMQATISAPSVTLNTPGELIGLSFEPTSYNPPSSLITTGQELPASRFEDPSLTLMTPLNYRPPSEQLETTGAYLSQQRANFSAPRSSSMVQYCPRLPTLSNDAEMVAFDNACSDMHQTRLSHQQLDNKPFNLDQYVNDFQQFATGEQQPSLNRHVDEQMQVDLNEQLNPDKQSPWVPQIDLNTQFYFDWKCMGNQQAYATSQAGPSAMMPDEPMLGTETDQDFLQGLELIDWSVFDRDVQEQEQWCNTPHTQDQRTTEVQ